MIRWPAVVLCVLTVCALPFASADEPPLPNAPSKRTPTPAMFTVEVLAVEITYGPGGADVPVRLDISTDGKTYSSVGAGKPVKPKTVVRFEAQAGLDTLDLRAKTPSRSFTNKTSNALVLRNGDDLSKKIASKGTRNPVGNQKQIRSLLKRFLDPITGTIKLAKNQRIILFELGVSSPKNSAYDLQDLVLLVERLEV